MLVQHIVPLPYSFGTIERALTNVWRAWTAGLDAADGAELLARVGVRIAGVPVYKPVRLELGRPRLEVGSHRMLMPVRWRASEGPGLYPVLEGELEVEASPDQTTIGLKANYTPPLGGLGSIVDRTFLRGLAQGTVTDFVERLAEVIEEQIQNSPPAIPGH